MRAKQVFFLAALALSLAWSASAQVTKPGNMVDPHLGRVAVTASCQQCHTCAQPSHDDPCLIACPRHGGKFRGAHRVDEGPEMVIIDQLADLYEPVVFSHNLHASMSMMSGGCANCHHYSEDSGSVPPCRECHDEAYNPTNLSRPGLKGAYHRQCMNCHRDWSHENACDFCHLPAGGEPGGEVPVTPTDIVGMEHPEIHAVERYIYETTYSSGPLVTFHHEDHVRLFGQNCVDCHLGDSCARCHHEGGQTEKGPVAHRIDTGMDHTVTCYSCHAQENCEFCHSTEEKPPFEHGISTGWPLNEHHQKQQCQACHGQVQEFTAPSTECTSCHIHWEVGSFDHNSVGLTLSEDHVEFDCEVCHEDGFESTPNCEMCHDEEYQPPEILPGWRD